MLRIEMFEICRTCCGLPALAFSCLFVSHFERIYYVAHQPIWCDIKIRMCVSIVVNEC